MSRISVKEKIVPAAVDILHRRGFHATGVHDIAVAAGVPQGSLYNHFENKEALCLAALDRYWEAGLNRLTVLSNPRVPALKRLKTYFRGLSQAIEKPGFESGCMIGNLALEMSPSSTVVRERLAVIFATWRRKIELCVKEAQSEGSMRRDVGAKTVAALLLDSWQGAAMRSKVNRDDSSLFEFEAVFKAFAPCTCSPSFKNPKSLSPRP